MSAYGAIDEGMIARKYEVTPMWEDSNQVDDMQRETLSDFRNDEATLESDIARRDYQSTSRIKLREAGSRGDNPEHPEMFLGFMDRDPRGIHSDPDYKKFSDQSWARKDKIEAGMYNDDDHSVPSQGIHPSKMQFLIKHSYPEVIKRRKIFSTSKDALKPGMSPVYRKSGSDIDRTFGQYERMDNKIPEGLDFRRNRTTALSNNSNIGWWQTVDHEFKVASYGKNYRQPGQQNINMNRRDTRYEMEFAIPYMQKPTKQMVALMSTAVASRTKRHDTLGDMEFKAGKEGMQGRAPVVAKISEMLREALANPDFGNSADSVQGKTKSVDKGQDALLRKFVETVHKMPANAQLALQEELRKFTGRTPKPSDVHPDRNKVVINPQIIEFMDDMVRKTGKTKPTKFGVHMNDNVASQDTTVQTDAYGPSINGIPVFAIKTNTKKADNKQRHDTVTRLKGNSKTTHVYQFGKPSLNQDRKGKVDPEQYAEESAHNLGVHNLNAVKDFDANRRDVHGDNDFLDNTTKDRKLAPMGRKYAMRNMEVDHDETEMNDAF